MLLEEKLTLQPIIVIIGSVVNVRGTYVVANDIWYNTQSILDAVSLTFKAFYAFDCEYPQKAINVWKFVQIAAFGIKSVSEKVGIKVKSMIKEVTLNEF